MFNAWNDWLCRDLLCTLSRLGRERTGLQFGQQGSFGILEDAQFFGSEGLAVASRQGIDLLASMPPIPTVWPEEYSLDMARAVILNLSEGAGARQS